MESEQVAVTPEPEPTFEQLAERAAANANFGPREDVEIAGVDENENRDITIEVDIVPAEEDEVMQPESEDEVMQPEQESSEDDDGDYNPDEDNESDDDSDDESAPELVNGSVVDDVDSSDDEEEDDDKGPRR